MARKRIAHIIGLGAVLAALAGGLPAPAAAEEFDEVKVLEKLEEEMDELREKGGWSKRGKLSEQLAACNDESPAQPFLPWGDYADYVSVPGGSFDGLPQGWRLNKDAEIVPWGDGHALFLPEGASVITAPMCISIFHPTMRLFAANTHGPRLRLEISVLYEDVKGKVKELKIGKLRGTDHRHPTPVLRLNVNRLAAVSETGLTVVAFKLKMKKVSGGDAALGDEGFLGAVSRGLLGDGYAAGEPGWILDDVYVDPFRAR